MAKEQNELKTCTSDTFHHQLELPRFEEYGTKKQSFSKKIGPIATRDEAIIVDIDSDKFPMLPIFSSPEIVGTNTDSEHRVFLISYADKEFHAAIPHSRNQQQRFKAFIKEPCAPNNEPKAEVVEAIKDPENRDQLVTFALNAVSAIYAKQNQINVNNEE